MLAPWKVRVEKGARGAGAGGGVLLVEGHRPGTPRTSALVEGHRPGTTRTSAPPRRGRGNQSYREGGQSAEAWPGAPTDSVD